IRHRVRVRVQSDSQLKVRVQFEHCFLLTDSDSSPNDSATSRVMADITASIVPERTGTIFPYPHMDNQNMSVVNATKIYSIAWNFYSNRTDPKCPTWN
uniref:Uncharacterized protein n=1 Tax=Romanomermis culicivorax TaxID=13658 RepID=A0A915HKM9_ROMCU